jgi:hypothetical protein
VKEQGAETVYLDGVVKAVQLYERNGFCKVCRSWRFTGTLTGLKSNHVRRMTMVDLDQVSALDQRSFGADRSYFLRRRLELFPELSYVMVDKERVVGFIFGRRGSDWVAAGPWVVEEIVEKPMELLQAFALDTRDIPINLGVLDTNQSAFELIRSFGFIAHSDSPWRMALGSSADLGTSPRCFAIGSAAKG